MRDLDTTIEKISQVVTLPGVLADVLGELIKEDVAIRDITDLIVKDPALTANVLRAANSPFFGLRWHIDNVGTAVGLLGLTEVTKLLLAFSLKQQLFALNWRQQDHLETLWQHSVNTAALAEMFVREFEIHTGGKEFTAALLHDIGKIVILQHYPDQFEQINGRIRSLNQRDILAETQVLDCSHADIGGRLGEMWNLPPEYIDVIRSHHNPNTSRVNAKLTSVVRFVDLVTESWGLGIGECPPESLFEHDISFNLLRTHEPCLRKRNLNDVIETLSSRFDERKQFVGIF